MSRPVRALINTAALKHNLNIVRQLTPGRRVMAVVKANGYGHDLLNTATALAGADEYGVASIDEALVLREAGITAPITALEGFFSASEISLFQQHDIAAVIHSRWQVDALEQTSSTGQIRVWLKVDSGMHRLGFGPEDVEENYARLSRCDAVDELALMTHLARADETDADATKNQLQTFKDILSRYDVVASAANSAGIIAWPDSHADIVRPGIMLYGSSPIDNKSSTELGLQAVMTVQSKLIAINKRNKGDAVGYGGDWVCPEDMTIGVVAFGYGDGYPRHAPSGTPVLVNDTRTTLIGRVSMDMILVDLRSVSAKVGDTVELWGSNISIDEVARHSGTISYELMCQLTERVQRVAPGH